MTKLDFKIKDRGPRLRLPAILCWILLSLFNNAYSQTTPITVSGLVKDANGVTLTGVTVRVKNENISKVTGEDGKYTINVPSARSVLVFTYVGFIPFEQEVGTHTHWDISLKPKSGDLNDIIVVGYGTQKKATLTGAVEQVSSQVFEDRAVTNVGLSLQGQTPGLLVTRTSPRPGNEGLAFQIRGATSVNGGSPLIIIDGVPALNYYSFQNMNPDDIESISILKDAAASIYGSRAANGVILVTSKRGKGKVKVEYSNNIRTTTNGITAFSPNMQQYATMWIEANKEETTPNWWGWASLANMQKMQQGVEGMYQTQYWGNIYLGNANRITEMFAQRYSYQHNLSISNRTDVSGYRLSFGYADNQATLATAYDGQKQYNLRFNYDYKLSDRIKLETGISMVDAVTRSPSVGLDAAVYGQEMPFFPAKNPYGEWYADYGTVGDRQPVAATSDGGRDNKSDLTGRIDLKATVKIVKDLSFEGMASYQDEQYRQERWVNLVQTYDWFGNKAQQTVSATQTTLSPTNPSDLTQNNPGYLTVANEFFYQYYSGLLKYNKTFNGVHNFSAVAGINAEKWQGKYLAAGRLNFTDLGVQDLNVANTTTLGNSGGKSQNGTYSYIARVNYNYTEKYLLELSGRRDGNSKFDIGYKYKNFAAASVGWVFTNEDFLKEITPIVSFGKIRASYGSMGNDVGLGNFDYTSLVNLGTTVLGSPAALQTSSSLANNGLISHSRTWEKVEQKNIGIDLSYLKSRLTTTFDYFIKDNVGMLSLVAYPSVLGGTPPKTNSGHLNVKGWEGIIGWKDSKKDFSYYISFKISNTHTLLKQLQGADNYSAGKNYDPNAGVYGVNGYPLKPWFLYKTAGYFQSQKDVDAYYAAYAAGGAEMAHVPAGGSSALRPGDTKRVDLNGDGVITAAGNASSDLKFMGDGDPHFTFGLNLGGSWKAFDLGVFFQGVGKQLIMRNGWMAYPFMAIYTNQNPNFLGKTWTATHTNAPFPRLTVDNSRSAWNYANNDFMLQNSRYIRLKSLILGYTLPQSISRKAKLNRLRVYFSGNDLWESSSIKDGYDPEMGETSQNSGYPFYRTWSFGLNVGL
ncbi:MAG TPA: SusC/RagA family TonB-linked outer membrane protein [Puia sp.]|nr:SusC/RagA family TonB-linked outer membrane protein [Puia sp.]